MEVQAHGNKFEDGVIKERTGLSKDEYDAMKVNGYTSTFDLTQGLIVDYNASIKTTGNNTICCSDLLRMMKHTDYRLIVGCYNQVERRRYFIHNMSSTFNPQTISNCGVTWIIKR